MPLCLTSSSKLPRISGLPRSPNAFSGDLALFSVNSSSYFFRNFLTVLSFNIENTENVKKIESTSWIFLKCIIKGADWKSKWNV